MRKEKLHELDGVFFNSEHPKCDWKGTGECELAGVCLTAQTTKILRSKVENHDGPANLRSHLEGSNCNHEQAKDQARKAKAVLPGVTEVSQN